MPSVRRLRNIVEAIDDHDALLVDLWGVVHDGERLNDGVGETLDVLAARGARVIFLSNSSRLGSQLTESLVSMGLRRDVFVEVVSSGDVTRDMLVRHDSGVFAGLSKSRPPRVLHVGSASYVPWLFDIGFDFVDDEAAELVIATGAVASEAELETLRARLAPLVARDIPLVCTNPDRVLVTKTGLGLAPGAVAHAYAAMGGATFLYGKPHSPIYVAALARFAALGIGASRIVAVGDMIETDIAGARAAGLTSVLVTSGVHAGELGVAPSDDALTRLFAHHGAAPDAVLPTFGTRGAIALDP